MKIRGHGNGIAIALAALAVVLAASGTAYAVTASTVTIADPTSPTHVAHVNSAGQLQTAVPLASIGSAGYLSGFQINQYTYVTSPTTATLAISQIRISNPGNNGTTFEQVGLYQVGVDSTGACSTQASRVVGYYNLSAGQESDTPFPAPLVVKPLGSAKYCLAFYVVNITGTPGYYSAYSVAAYVVAGTYTGIGTGATPGGVTAHSPKISR